MHVINLTMNRLALVCGVFIALQLFLGSVKTAFSFPSHGRTILPASEAKSRDGMHAADAWFPTDSGSFTVNSSAILHFTLSVVAGFLLGVSAVVSPSEAIDSQVYKQVDDTFRTRADRDKMKRALETARSAVSQVSQESRQATKDAAFLTERALKVAESVREKTSPSTTDSSLVDVAVDELQTSRNAIAQALKEPFAYADDTIDWNDPIVSTGKNLAIAGGLVTTVVLGYMLWLYQLTEAAGEESSKKPPGKNRSRPA